MRTDEQVQCDVTEALQWEPTITWGDITVTVSHGIVTLSGTVPHFPEKADTTAWNAPGVLRVDNHLAVSY